MVDRVSELEIELNDASWLALSAVVERFEAAWQTQGEAAVADFVPGDSDPCRRHVLLALIKTDQEYRWRAAQRPLVESYLQQWPELADGDETALELLAAECLTRAAFDRPVQRAELEQRFPRIAGRIDLAEIEQQAHRETVSSGPGTDSDFGEFSETVAGPAQPLGCDAFLGRLTAAGLMTAAAVQECLAGLAEQERPVDGLDLARRLVLLGKLTAYQARTLVQNRDDPLVLGNYVILDRLGQGGMGQVFKAVHRRMDRIVALKMLTPELVRTPESLRRFQQEVKAAARLSHPNIVIAHDADEADGRPFLVMEYVEGIDLATLVQQQGPLPPGLALDCILQAARGLQYAHEHGVVHRDIKPANLVVSFVSGHSSVVSGQWSAAGDHGQRTNDKGPQAILKILDMGLAHLDSADAGQDELTGAGQIMGTVDYMAPEQAVDARRADGRADIYGLGATLWYLLTGRSMYAGRTTAEKLLACQSGSIPSLAGVFPDLPPPLEAVFRRMVAKRPEDRYQTMAELIADLESLLPQLGVALLGTPSSVGSADQATPRLGVPSRATLPSSVGAGDQATPRLGVPSRATLPSSVGSGDQATPRLGVPSRATLSENRPWWWRHGRKLVVAGVGGLLLIWLGIWVVIRDERGQEVGRVRLPSGGSVTQELETSSPRPGTPGRGVGGEGGWDLPPNAPSPAIAPFDAAGAKSHQQAWAPYLGVPVEIENSLGMKFMLIPPGEFDMGSTEAEVAELRSEGTAVKQKAGYILRVAAQAPRHRVRITRPFWLGRHEVTRGQFRRFVEDSGYQTEGEQDGKGGYGLVDGQQTQDPRFSWDADLGFDQTDDHPLVNVSWSDAAAFCAWLSKKEGAESYLPSEAQWEYACRAGTATLWYSGDEANVALDGHAWFDVNAGQKTHPVGQKSPNAWGLFDMHGNVWEWCRDWFDPGYYSKSPLNDPTGPSEGSGRVYRGGGWASEACECRTSYRFCLPSFARNCTRGFRLARQVAWPEAGQTTTDPGQPSATPAQTPPSPEASSADPGTPGSGAGGEGETSPLPGTPGRGVGGEGGWNLPPNAPPPAIAPFDAAGAKSHQQAWAKYLGVGVEMENSLAMPLVLIPPGEFDMGSADADVAFNLKRAKAAKEPDPDHINRLSAEVPRHRVRITQPFWLGRHEVTRGQFRRFVEDRAYRTEAERDGKGGFGLLDGQHKQDPRFVWNADLGFEQTDEHPVVNVSWSDASAFCAWLSEKEGDKSYLPSEAQWEYACRAGTTTPWYSGGLWSELKSHAWFVDTARTGTRPVGQKSANPWGLFDVHGNVWEWCADWYDAAYYATSPRDDPPGASAGPYRVSRGGSWTNAAGGCTSAYRCGWQVPLGRADCRGFRLARQFDDGAKESRAKE